MKKTEALAIVNGFGQVRASDVRRIAVNQANGWLLDIETALICRDSAAVTRRLAEYDKALALAFA